MADWKTRGSVADGLRLRGHFLVVSGGTHDAEIKTSAPGRVPAKGAVDLVRLGRRHDQLACEFDLGAYLRPYRRWNFSI